MSGISTRGPRNVLVLDRTAVPINLVTDYVCSRMDVAKLKQKFPITEDEIFLCAETWADVRDATENDFIEFSVTTVDGEIDVITKGISDWVFLSLVSIGRQHKPSCIDYDELYLIGVQAVFVDCFLDIVNNNTHYELSDVHNILYKEFSAKYGQEITSDNAKDILRSLNIDYRDFIDEQ